MKRYVFLEMQLTTAISSYSILGRYAEGLGFPYRRSKLLEIITTGNFVYPVPYSLTYGVGHGNLWKPGALGQRSMVCINFIKSTYSRDIKIIHIAVVLFECSSWRVLKYPTAHLEDCSLYSCLRSYRKKRNDSKYLMPISFV